VDFPPFAALADIPMAMTAHVVYSALDPGQLLHRCRPTVIGEVDPRPDRLSTGLIMSDDLSMKALKGSFRERRRTRASLPVVTSCCTAMANMDRNDRSGSSSRCTLDGTSAERADRALSFLRGPEHFDQHAAEVLLEQLIGPVS
jgi:beta-N-acetylhexosaminidase